MLCSPHKDLAVNPAKILAIGIADSNPVLWGGTVLAARAARRIAESIRRATGRTALAADAEHLLPVLEATAPADVFADPFADGGVARRPALVLLDDLTGDPAVAETRDRLEQTARDHGVRVETISSEADGDVARYAAMLSTGTYAATYLQLGLRTPERGVVRGLLRGPWRSRARTAARASRRPPPHRQQADDRRAERC